MFPNEPLRFRCPVLRDHGNDRTSDDDTSRLTPSSNYSFADSRRAKGEAARFPEPLRRSTTASAADCCRARLPTGSRSYWARSVDSCPDVRRRTCLHREAVLMTKRDPRYGVVRSAAELGRLACAHRQNPIKHRPIQKGIIYLTPPSSRVILHLVEAVGRLEKRTGIEPAYSGLQTRRLTTRPPLRHQGESTVNDGVTDGVQFGCRCWTPAPWPDAPEGLCPKRLESALGRVPSGWGYPNTRMVTP